MVEKNLNLENDSTIVELMKFTKNLTKNMEIDHNYFIARLDTYFIARLDTHMTRIAEVELKNKRLEKKVEEMQAQPKSQLEEEPKTEESEEEKLTHFYRVRAWDEPQNYSSKALPLQEIAKLPFTGTNYHLTYAYSAVVKDDQTIFRDMKQTQ